MENGFSSGAAFASNPPCTPDTGSLGIWLGDSYRSSRRDGSLTAQGIGIDLKLPNPCLCFCSPPKAQGTHYIGGGMIHDVGCVTNGRLDGTTLLAPAMPGRSNYQLIDCP